MRGVLAACRVVVVSIVVVMAGTVVAQDSTDTAGNYSAGPVASLDQGAGWATGTVTVDPDDGNAAFTAASATTVSGSSLMDSDAGSLAWVFDIDVPGTFTGGNTEVQVKRSVSGVTHQTGEQMFVKVQVPDAPNLSYGNARVLFQVVPTLTTLVGLQIDAGSWAITHSGGPTSTTAAVSDPYAITVTNNGGSVNVHFKNLTTSVTQDYDVTPTSTGDLGRLDVSMNIVNIDAADTATLILNDMKYNAAGGLPVELSSFTVD